MERLLTAQWWILVASIAFAAVGIIQHAKGLLPALASWAWGLVLPALCLCLAVAFLPWPEWLLAALLADAVAQVGYETLLKLALGFVDRVRNGGGRP